jgi:hypothetical protein
MPSSPSSIVRNGDVVTVTTASEQWTLRISDIVGIGAVSRTDIVISTRLMSGATSLQLVVPWGGAADRDRVREFAVALLTPAE